MALKKLPDMLSNVDEIYDKKHYLNELVDKYYDEVEKTALRIFRSREFAQDLTQNVFMKATQNYDKLKNHKNPLGWLYSTTWKTSYEMFRTLKKYSKIEKAALDEFACAIEDDYELEDCFAQQCMKALEGNEESQQLFANYHLSGLSLDEISAEMELEKTVIKSRLYRIHQKLKKIFNKTPFLLIIFFHI